MKHPIQPIALDEHETLRFKDNAIVRHLLDHGGIDMNKLATLEFSQEDRAQFAQLIGYSLSGFGELNYVTDDDYNAADKMARAGMTEEQARIASLEEILADIRNHLKGAAVAAFSIHPDDLHA